MSYGMKYKKYSNIQFNNNNNNNPNAINLYLKVNDFTVDNISLLDATDNKVIDGTFTNIIYTDYCIIFNGVFILLNENQDINTNEMSSEKVVSNRQELDNIVKHYIDALIVIEKQILELYKSVIDSKKKPAYNIRDCLQDLENNNGYNKLKTIHSIKISGVWESKTGFGLNYKFLNYVTFN